MNRRKTPDIRIEIGDGKLRISYPKRERIDRTWALAKSVAFFLLVLALAALVSIDDIEPLEQGNGEQRDP